MPQDLRYAFRRLIAAPAFALVAVLTLALGIGANAAIGGIIAAVLLRPLPLPDPDQVVAVRAVNVKEPQVSTISSRDVEDWREGSRTIEAFGAWRDWSFARQTPAGREGYYGLIATPGMFSVLGVRPVLGRVFSDEENQPGRDQVILLTESTWRGRFGADPTIVGRTLVLSRAPRGELPFTVIGVMPDLDLPSLGDVTFYAPSSVDEDAHQGRWLRNRRVWARVQGGRSIREARTELTGLAARLALAHPDSHGGWTVDVKPLVETEVGSTRTTLLFFSAAVGFVFLIACANVAGLLIARAAGRQREFAVRSALGARPRHMVKLVLAEAAMLAVTAGCASLLLRVWLLDVIASSGPAIPRMAPIPATLTLAMTLTLSFVAAALFGLLPAWHAARIGIAEVIRRDSGRAVSRGGLGARTWLVGIQMALALMLLAGAAVSLRTLARLLGPPPGFDPRGVLVTQLYPSTTKYSTREALAQLAAGILNATRATPGVQSASTTSAGPLFGGQEPVEIRAEGSSPSPDGTYPTARYFDTSPGYFHTMGAILREGRDFSDRDVAGAPGVAIVNDALVARFWPGQRALGRRVTLVREGRELEIVGVVQDFAKGVNREPIEPEIYWPYQQQPRWAFYLIIRVSSPPDTVIPTLRARLAGIDPDLVPPRISTMDALIARATRGERFGALVLGLFAGSALLLAALGTYGLVSYAASQRTREFGIRISFGAAPADIQRLVLSTGMRPILIGAAVGLAGSFATTRILASAIPGAGEPDVLAIGVAVTMLVLTAVSACLIPARRATRVDPIVALGAE